MVGVAGAAATGKAAGKATSQLAAQLTRALVRLGYRADVARAVVRLSSSRTTGNPTPKRPLGAAELDTVRRAAAFRAWFLQRAGQRIHARLINGLQLEAAIRAEKPYVAAHHRAVTRRRRAARAVDAVSRAHGRILEWRATLDERTTPECRAAHEHLFYADQPPMIGYPGTVHPFCRCTAVPASLFGASNGWVDEATAHMMGDGHTHELPEVVNLAWDEAEHPRDRRGRFTRKPIRDPFRGFGPPPGESWGDPLVKAYWKRRQDALEGAHFTANGDTLDPHEVEFVERMLDRGERLAWQMRSKSTPGFDFTWLSHPDVPVIELKTSSTARSALRAIRKDVRKAAEHQGRPITKSDFMVDVGAGVLNDEMRVAFSLYNQVYTDWPIRRLWVLAEDGRTLEAIRLRT